MMVSSTDSEARQPGSKSSLTEYWDVLWPWATYLHSYASLCSSINSIYGLSYRMVEESMHTKYLCLWLIALSVTYSNRIFAAAPLSWLNNLWVWLVCGPQYLKHYFLNSCEWVSAVCQVLQTAFRLVGKYRKQASGLVNELSSFRVVKYNGEKREGNWCRVIR